MILILISPRNAGLPFARWLGEERGRLLAVTADGVDPGPGFLGVERVADYTDDTAVHDAVRRLRAHHDVTRVLALAEVDVERAAGLREELGLPGQRPESARAYRDKVLMKEYARAGGIRVPAFAPVHDEAEVLAFMAAHPGPVVVKPRDGSGSTGVTVLHRPEDARAVAERVRSGGHEAEEFVTGRFCHVDALHVGGEFVVSVPSVYTDGGCLSHWTDSGNGSWTLEAGDPLHARLVEETRRLVTALPPAPALFVHAEFFVTEAEEIILCEIAGRVGGTPIPPCSTPYWAWIHGSCGPGSSAGCPWTWKPWRTVPAPHPWSPTSACRRGTAGSPAYPGNRPPGRRTSRSSPGPATTGAVPATTTASPATSSPPGW